MRTLLYTHTIRHFIEPYVGFGTKHRLRQLISAEEVTDRQVNDFHRIMFSYMESVTGYLINHLPIKDEHLKKVVWIDPDMFPGRCEDMIDCAMRYFYVCYWYQWNATTNAAVQPWSQLK